MSVEAVLKAVDANFTATMEQAVQSLGEVVKANNSANNQIASGGNASEESSSRLTSGFKEMASSLGLVAVGAKAFQVVSDSVGSAISRIDTLNNATRTFTNMGFNTKQISSAMDGLKVSIQGLPTPLNEAVQGVQMIAASTGDLGKSQQVYSALNDAIIGFGGNTNDVSNAIVQLSQAFANGKIDAQTWNSMMQSNLGPTLNAVAKKMGMTTAQLKDGLSTGKISVADFQSALIDLDKNGGGGLKSLHKIALDSTSGISTSIENAKTAITRGVADMIGNINKGLSSNGFPTIAQMITEVGSLAEQALSKIGTAIPMVMAALNPLIKMIGDLARNNIFKTLAISVITFIGAFKGITAVLGVIDTLKSAFTAFSVIAKAGNFAEGFGEVLSTLAGKSKIAAAAQAALNAVMDANPWVIAAAAIAAVVAALVYFFTQTKTGRAMWSDFTTWLASAWQSLVGVATTVWNAIGTAITTVVNMVKAGWQGLTSFLSALWTGIVAIATTVWNMIVTVVMTVVTAIQAVWSGFSSFMSGIWDGIVSVASSIWDSLVDIVSSVWNAITSVVSGAVSAVSSVISAGFNTASSIVSSVMNAMRAVISSVWNGIKSLFSAGVNFIKSVVHVDLSAEGRAIMNSFFNGLKSVWESIKSFVSGIAGWIKAHKGPISLDRKLLIPAGQAIMNGLNEGLTNGFENVQSNVSAMAGAISNAATVSVPPIQDSAFTKSISAVQDKMQNMSANVEGTITTNNAAMTNVTARMWQSRMEQMMGMAVDKLDNVNQHPVVTLDTANQLAEHSNKVNADLYHSWR